MTKPRSTEPRLAQEPPSEAPYAGVYTSRNAPQDGSVALLCDCPWMLLAPCVPLTRAVSWTSGRPAAAFVLVLTATLFIGGIVCAGLAATTEHPFLQIDVLYAVPAGWIMSGIGVFYSLPLDGAFWFFQALHTANCGDRELPVGFEEYSVDAKSAMLTILHLVSQCGMLFITYIVQCDLNNQSGSQVGCCEYTCTLCCPCWTFARAMDRAKRSSTRVEDRAGLDELPAYAV